MAIWFRVPQKTITAARAEWRAIVAAIEASSTPDSIPIPSMVGVIPLVTFGPRTLNGKKSKSIILNSKTTFSQDYNFFDSAGPGGCQFVTEGIGSGTLDFPGTTLEKNAVMQLDPGYIGVNCRTDRTLLDFKFVSTDTPTVAGASYQVIDRIDAPDPMPDYFIQGVPSFCPYDFGIEYFPPNTAAFVAPLYAGTRNVVYTDDSNNRVATARPQSFQALPSQRFGFSDPIATVPGSGLTISGAGEMQLASDIGIDVSADHWHVLIISLDAKTVTTKGRLVFNGDGVPKFDGGTVSNASEMFLSFDDVNYNGRKISYYTKKSATGNAILTSTGWEVFQAVSENRSDTFDTGAGHTLTTISAGQKQPSYTYPSTPVLFGEMYLPGDENTTRHCEMGEFQMFTDVTLDTSLKVNRRIFVTENGKPASMGKAKDFFNKEPEVKLHGSSNWKKAKNTGSFNKDDISGDLIDPGVAVGQIDTYRPNPNLFDDQGLPQT
jgi:hypothetical protein